MGDNNSSSNSKAMIKIKISPADEYSRQEISGEGFNPFLSPTLAVSSLSVLCSHSV
jgi:hypothetical protein